MSDETRDVDARGVELSVGDCVIVRGGHGGFGDWRGMLSSYRGPALFNGGRHAVVAPIDGGPDEVVDFREVYKLAEKR